MTEVEGIIKEYFGGLFQSTNPAPELIDEILENVATVVTLAMKQQLTAPFSPAEVISALS